MASFSDFINRFVAEDRLTLRGKQFFEEQLYSKAFGLWATAAARDYPPAQFHLSRCYFDGIGVPINHSEGMRWLRASARAGFAEAQFLLSSLLASGFRLPSYSAGRLGLGINNDKLELGPPEFYEALDWAKKAGAQGNGRALALAGFILLTGPEDLRDDQQGRIFYQKSAQMDCPEGHLGYGLILIEKESKVSIIQEGINLIVKAHEAGIVSATYKLAELYEQGRGVVQNVKLAFEFYKKAAEGGLANAQFTLGIALIDGREIVRDTALGEHWLVRAAHNGHAEAANQLGKMYLEDRSRSDAISVAARWYEIAAQAGHGEAARNLGYLHLTGNGVTKDLIVARRWLEVAADAGDEKARIELANSAMHENGFGTDPSKIAAWFMTAAANGDPTSEFNLGLCYLNSIGLAQDEERAAFWIGRAAERLPEAQLLFGEMLLTGRGIRADRDRARLYIQRAAERSIPEAIKLMEDVFGWNRKTNDVGIAEVEIAL